MKEIEPRPAARPNPPILGFNSELRIAAGLSDCLPSVVFYPATNTYKIGVVARLPQAGR